MNHWNESCDELEGDPVVMLHEGSKAIETVTSSGAGSASATYPVTDDHQPGRQRGGKGSRTG